MKKSFTILLLLLLAMVAFTGCYEEIIIEDPVITVDGKFVQGSEDFVIDVYLKGNEFVGILGNNITADDYLFNNTTLTIRSTYLNSLSAGEHSFTFKTKEKEISFIVEIELSASAPEIRFENNIYNLGVDRSLKATVDLNNSDLVAVMINSVILGVDSYTLLENELIIKSEALDELNPSAENELKVTTEFGHAVANFVINDVPIIKDKEDFIKLPGEEITKQDFKALVVDTVGSLNYQYTLKSGDGVLNDNLDGSFNYTPNTILPNEVIITFTVTDSYNQTTSKDIILTYKTVNPKLANQHYTINQQNDLGIIVNLLGNEVINFEVDFVNLTGNGITANNYSYADSLLTISKDFLNSLSLGAKTFTLKTTAGECNFEILIADNPEITLQSTDNVINEGFVKNLLYTINLKGATFTGLYLGDEQLSEGRDFSLEGNNLTLNGNYLSSLSYGPNTLTLKSEYGQVDFVVIFNDQPTIQEKTDFIKLPGEIISHEDFRALVKNQYGALTYLYEKQSGDGLLTNNPDGSFDFDPEGVFAGEVVIRLTARDEYGIQTSSDIILTYKAVNPYIYDAGGNKIVDKASAFTDVVMTVDTYGIEDSSLYFEMTDITLDEISIGSENYILKTNGNNRLFTVKAEYLNSLEVGVYTFALHTQAGASEFIIEVKDTRPVSVDQNSFAYILGVDDSDLVVHITPYNNIVTSTSFTISGIEFLEGTSFVFVDNTLTVLHTFVDSLTPGIYKIRINDLEMITVLIKEATAPEIVSNKKINIERSNLTEDVIVNLVLYGLDLETVLYQDDTLVDAANYLITSNTLVIYTSYLSTLNYGPVNFIISNSNGEDSFIINVSDKPLANIGSQNVTKYTNEGINNEAFRVTPISPWTVVSFNFIEVVYYDYSETPEGSEKVGVVSVDGKEITGDFGRIYLNDETKSFSVERTPGWFGTIIFTYTATDSTGVTSDNITMDIVYKQLVPVVAEKDEKLYYKALGSTEGDIVYTIIEDSYFFPVYKLMNGEYELRSGTDYTVSEKSGSYRYFTVKATYLNTLSYGENIFTLYTEGGRVDFIITVVDVLSTSANENNFDKNAPVDVEFSLSGFPLEILSIKNNGVNLLTEDYSFQDGLLTIKGSYLNNQNYGTVKLIINNGYGESELFIEVTNSKEPNLLTTDAVYLKSSLAPVEIDFEVYDKTFEALFYNDVAVDSSNYHYTNGVLMILGSYLETLTESTLNFTVQIGSYSLPFDITVETAQGLPEVTLASTGYQIDKNNDVYYDVNLNSNTLSEVNYLGTVLTKDVDYTYDDINNQLSLKASFLNDIYKFNSEYASLMLKTVENNNVGFAVPFDNASYRVLNGGFETGNLYGWNSFGIWKNEAGMLAWTDDRVVNGGYFDQNYAYNRDGNFNLGIYGGAISKDSGQERMGHLRSSDFLLGGSGWISFKLGGGQNTSFAYISVRRTLDNYEVARFGNTRFNQPTDTGNGEAYLFQYYFDLSTVANLGESLYFTISDNSSFEWCVLSADSFYTYYGSEPVLNPEELAINIVPQILNVETADNTIKNGYFDSNLDNWQNVNGQFKIENGSAMSNVSGDGATAVLRSSAFNVIDKKYIRFDWAGRLKADKQIFVSVKEVGTNIEVLRFVRRDNLGGYEGGDFQNHMLDLSGLDATKLYYLEFADNVNASWGLTKIDAIRLVDQNEFNSVVASDRAVMISGIETTFNYTLPY
jgi:hypothetical protein